MADPAPDDPVVRIATLEEEVERLRVIVARLETEKAALLRASVDREFERPPHYR